MNISFPLKSTSPIDFPTYFKPSIEKFFGPAYYTPVSGFFATLSTLRKELDYKNYEKMIQADARLCEELESKILKYLSYILILDRKFKFEPNYPKSINFPVNWSDSFKNNTVFSQLSSMKLEIVGHLYNLALAELVIGSSLAIKPEESDKKAGLKRFRVGIWAVKEIKSLLPSINFAKAQSFADLSLQNLSMIETIFLGFSYFVLFEVHEKNEVALGFNNLASIVFAACKNFKVAKSVLEQNKGSMPADLAKKLSVFLFFNEVYTEGLACLKMTKNHENLLQDQPNGNHMGFAVSYAKAGALILDSALKNSAELSSLPGNFQQKLRALADNLKNLARILENKNNQIYKNKEFGAQELPGAPEISQKLFIGPIVPEIFQKNVSEESLFETFVSEELEKELHDIKALLEDHKINVKKQVEQCKDYRNEVFSKNSINFITNFSQSQMAGKKEIPLALRTKFQELENRGGANKLKLLHRNLIEKCLKCGEIVKNIRMKLENEKKEEAMNKEKYKHLWTTTASDVLNYEYYQCLNDLLGKFNQAQAVDESIFLKFNKNKENIEVFAQGEAGILKKIPNSVDSTFFQANNQTVIFLKEKTDQVEKLLLRNEQLLAQFVEFFNNPSQTIEQKIIEAKKKSAIPSQIAQTVLAPVHSLTNEINENIKSCTMLIDSIVLDSNGLRNKMLTSSVNAKSLEEINYSLEEVTQILDDLARGSSFYDGLCQYLESLDQTVDDYVMARQAQFEDLIKMIENSKPRDPPPGPPPKKSESFNNKLGFEEKKSNENENNPVQLFYNEEKSQFPLGSSVFLPSKKGQIDGNALNIFESTVVTQLSSQKK